MIRYSKPLGSLLSFKGDYFARNEAMLAECMRLYATYVTQPRRLKCKNCDTALVIESRSFIKHGIQYSFCDVCGHLNGAYEDTEAFCQALYADDGGKQYAANYLEADAARFADRVREVYAPKAQFLKESILERESSLAEIDLCDFGAGAGYFVGAAVGCGFRSVFGYEPSQTLVELGNRYLGRPLLRPQENVKDIIGLAQSTDAGVVSFIGVLEHLQSPREVLRALATNASVRYVYVSVPLFSPTIVTEALFPEVMPRHLAAAHTHLYTESSIDYFCEEFKFERASEWWFGLDIADWYRSVLLALGKEDGRFDGLQSYWRTTMLPLVDDLQKVLDAKKLSSEVHIVLTKKG